MVIPRVAAVGAVVAVAVGVLATPAHADGGLSVSVARVAPGQVDLLAAVPGATATATPPLTVTRDGYKLSYAVRAAQANSVPSARLRDVVVVLDTSAAMPAEALKAAQDGLLAFVDTVPPDVALGLVTAADEPAVAMDPGRNHTAFREAVAAVSAGGSTAVYAGVRKAADATPGAADRRLLVIAGSQDTAADADAIVGDLSDAGQRIDLVTVGAAPDGLGDLRRAVTATGGNASRAANPAALTQTVGAAAGTIPPLVTISVAVPPEMAGDASTLTVTAAGGATAEVDVTFGPSPAAVAGDTEDSLLPTFRPGLLAIGVFVVLLIAILLVVFGVGGGSRRNRRLDQVQQFRMAGRGTQVTGRTAQQQADRAARTLANSMIKAGGGEERIAQRLDSAGMTLKPRQWMAIRLGAIVLGAVLFTLLMGLPGVFLGALVGWLLALLYPRIRERRRRQAFADQLPDALQLIVGSLRSGFSLAQAIDAVVKDSPPGPLTVELGRAVTEVRLGSDLADAIERAAKRVDNEDLTWAVVAIRIQRDTGGNLAEILETTLETLRERDRLRRHVRALSAEGRISAYLLIGLPFALAGWMILVRRDYVSALWTTPLGLMMLGGALILMAIGTAWMARWMKVEV